jgi:hypothetical protein
LTIRSIASTRTFQLFAMARPAAVKPIQMNRITATSSPQKGGALKKYRAIVA